MAGKIFWLKERISLEEIDAVLKGRKLEEEYSEDVFKQTLLTEIQDLTLKSGMLRGSIAKDHIIHVRQKGNVVPVIRTVEAPFAFDVYEDKLLLVIVEKKWRANNLANVLSEMVYEASGFILEVRIPPENLKRYHEHNPEGTKIIFFRDMDIPNVKKLSLYGGDLANASLYGDFLSHGDIWYVVVTSKNYGYVVGLTGNGVVTVFNRVAPSEFLTYVTSEVFPLIKFQT